MSAARSAIEEWVRVRDGGGDAESAIGRVNALFAAQQDFVYAVCMKFVGEPERARELAQDTLLVAWGKLEQYDGRCRFSTWLYGIARNLSFNAIRRHGELLTADGVLEEGEAGTTVLLGLLQEERESLLTAAAAAVLSPIEQEAIHLRYVENLPQDRITELLALQQSTGARGLLQRCRRKLDRELRRRLAEMGRGSSFIRSFL